MTETAVLEALAELGTTSSEIAAKLEAAGVKGRRHAADACPIANYLARRFGQRFTCYDVVLCNGEPVGYPPAPVFDFIQKYDFGTYPQLEDLPPEEPEAT